MSPIADRLAAARGEGGLPPEAKLQRLVILSHDPDEHVRAEARRTLEAWPSDTLKPLLANRSISPVVLDYFLTLENLRSELLPELLANRSTPHEAIAELAAIADLESVKILLDNIDRLRTQALIALKSNSAYLKMHESRLTALEEGFIFEPSFLDLLIAEAQLEDERQQAVALSEEEITKFDEEIAKAEVEGNEERKHESIYAKIARMTVSQKVQLALKGTKDERGMLIRDSSKVVSRAVLGSPKLTEAEVETFSALKSVSDEVLRMISMNRKFMKGYNVLKNIANNPRSPIDVALPLVQRLLPQDQRAVMQNKNVSDVVRKSAEKLVKQKGK